MRDTTLAPSGGFMSGFFEIYVETHFSAAHSLRGYPGDCARVHGHNWIVAVFIKCRELNEIGIGIDFREIKQAVKDLLKNFDHCYLNDLQPFHDLNPTSENMARYVYKTLGNKINSNAVSVSKVKVSESPNSGAFYWEE
jgi:6-pyruvoyltetrahydropterin/6-carboxytetrahydropterin synthase